MVFEYRAFAVLGAAVLLLAIIARNSVATPPLPDEMNSDGQ